MDNNDKDLPQMLGEGVLPHFLKEALFTLTRRYGHQLHDAKYGGVTFTEGKMATLTLSVEKWPPLIIDRSEWKVDVVARRVMWDHTESNARVWLERDARFMANGEVFEVFEDACRHALEKEIANEH